MTRRLHSPAASSPRTGAIMIFAAIILVVMFAFVAFSVDVGYMTMTKGQLQNAADAAAMAGVRELANGEPAVYDAAKSIALENQAAGEPVSLVDSDIEVGAFNFQTKVFTATTTGANAVKVTTRIIDKPLFFAPIIRNYDFDMAAESIAMLNPRDIVFVVDLSGSMNDDTEPCWATQTINDHFGPLGYPGVANPLVQDLYTDFGFGTFPGAYQWVGAPLGVAADEYAFAEMTKDDGPLTDPALSDWYRINNLDNEPTRKLKGYRWIIDYQLPPLMPNAYPPLNSTTQYDYWQKYLDYVINDVYVGAAPPDPTDPTDPPPDGGGGGSGTTDPPPTEPPPPEPPVGRLEVPGAERLFVLSSRNRTLGVVASLNVGVTAELLLAPAAASFTTLPGVPRRGSTNEVRVPSPHKGSYEIDEFNNPNIYTFPATDADPDDWENTLGYITYVQCMLDWGRDRTPSYSDSTSANPSLTPKTPLSPLSPYCPKHYESTAGGTFLFPPREQPMHAVRRAMIAAIHHVKQINGGIAAGYGDNVAIVAYDGLDAYHAPQVVQPLTSNYDAAMTACTNLSAVSDIGATTATEAGLILAANHLQPPANGGAGRSFASKVIVLLTDGIPNAWSSSQSTIDNYILANGSGEYYNSAYVWYNACLVQAAKSTGQRISLYPIGMGLGTDYDFMDRMARLARTDKGGLSVRGSGNPAEYEQRLTEIFGEIVKNPGGRIVE